MRVNIQEKKEESSHKKRILFYQKIELICLNKYSKEWITPSIILKISSKNKTKSVIRVLISIFVLLLLTTLVIRDFVNYSNDGFELKRILLSALLLAIFSDVSLPTLFLHLNYMKTNKNEAYEIKNKIIIKRKNGVETIYNFDEIDTIYLYQSSAGRRTLWNAYHFMEINLKSGEILYLTSLLHSSELETILKNNMDLSYYKITNRLFPVFVKKRNTKNGNT